MIIKAKIPTCKCGETLLANLDEIDGSLVDGYIAEYWTGECQKCKKEYIIKVATLIPKEANIHISIKED